MFGQVQDLSGLWEFVFLPAPAEDFCMDELAFHSFAPVPGCFDLLEQYFLRRGTGVYRRKVEIGGRAALTLEGVGLRGKVFWDGKFIGGIDCAFSQRIFRFDSGEYGTHELTVAVNNEFDDTPSSLFRRNYDFYAHGGIYRKVTIKPIGEYDLEFLKVLPLEPENGAVEVEFKLWGNTEHCTEATVFFDSRADGVRCGLRDGGFRRTLQVPSPRIWSLEEPHLHTIKIAVNEDIFTAEFGLRSIEVRSGGIFLNHKKLFLTGVNRHDAHPDFGYAVPQSVQIQDILMLKAAGFNCIRGSHYPQSGDFLSLCDRMGMLVWEETLGWGNHETSLTDEGFAKAQIREAERMALKSINHPSVIMHGFLNECQSHVPSARPLLKSLAETLRKIDRSRPVTFASNRLRLDCCLDFVDIISFNTYPGWYGDNQDQFFNAENVEANLNDLAEFASQEIYQNKALLISEIGAEAMPGLRGGQRWSEDYQADLHEFVMRYMRKSPRYSGVMLWQYCDTRTYMANTAQQRATGFNFKGLVDGHRRPKEAWRRISALLNKK